MKIAKIGITAILVLAFIMAIGALVYQGQVERGLSMHVNCYEHGELVFTHHYTRDDYFHQWRDEDGYKFATMGMPEIGAICVSEYYE